MNNLYITKAGNEKHKKGHRGFRWIFRLFVLWFCTFILMSAIILFEARTDNHTTNQCVIVLGAGLRGAKPSLTLEQRLKTAVTFAKANPTCPIIVSGGMGSGEDITEASAMEKYMVEHGIKASSIMKEQQSTSTYENLKYSKALFEKKTKTKLKDVMLITSNFHMFRAKMLAERVGLKAYGMSAGIPYYLYPKLFLREYFAVIKSYIFDR